MKAIAPLLLCLCVAACDPVTQVGVVLTPSPALQPDSAQVEALALSARIAERHELVSSESFVKSEPAMRWSRCYGTAARPSFTLCERIVNGEVQFRFYAPLQPRLSPLAQQVRSELVDSLQGRFGATRVRECYWRAAREPEREGCPAPRPG